MKPKIELFGYKAQKIYKKFSVSNKGCTTPSIMLSRIKLL